MSGGLGHSLSYLSTVGNASTVLSVLPNSAESADAAVWKDLADVKCRVYRASFAEKLHDLAADPE
jgi:hypothetical protein